MTISSGKRKKLTEKPASMPLSHHKSETRLPGIKSEAPWEDPVSNCLNCGMACLSTLFSCISILTRKKVSKTDFYNCNYQKFRVERIINFSDCMITNHSKVPFQDGLYKKSNQSTKQHNYITWTSLSASTGMIGNQWSLLWYVWRSSRLMATLPSTLSCFKWRSLSYTYTER